MKSKSFVCLFLLCLIRSIVYGQQNDINTVIDHLQHYANEYPQEKVYLHLDKPYYTVGDDIWFKGYVTIGQYNNLSGLSKILYIDLINPAERIVQSLRLPLLAGVTMGDFKLADSLQEGNYRIRAYTNWMRNFDADSYFDRTLSIGNARSDDIITHSSFTYQNSEIHTVNTAITLTDLDGNALTDAEVSYQVMLEGRNIGRGKEKTDANGHIAFDFVNKQTFNLKKGIIDLSIHRPEKPTIQKTIPIKTTSKQHSIQFFPESGHLIAGNLTKVGFKAQQPDGLSIAAKGVVEDEAGAQIAEFESTHAGMGSFLFIPEAGKKYTASVKFEDGSALTEPLPLAQQSGYAIAINNELDKAIFVQAHVSADLVKGQEIAILLQRNGNVFYASKAKVKKSDLAFSIPRENIPSGVSQLTLLSTDMQPLAERIIFNVNEQDFLPLTVASDKKVYGPKEKATISIVVGNETDSSKIAVLSAAVVDINKVPIDGHHEPSIWGSLLLGSNIKGYIENPAYYFENIDITKKRNLDNLMLTQGWSRINWQEVTAGKFPPRTHQPEQDMRISGLVTKMNGKTPVPKATVTILSTSNIGAILDTVTDANGRFNFDRLLFYDSTKFVVQARDERGRKNVEIQLDEGAPQQITQNRNAPDATVNVNQSISAYLKNAGQQFSELEKYGLKEKSILLEEVKITREGIKNKVRHSSNLNGPGNADQVLTAEDLSTCPSLEMCLQGRLTGVIFRNGVPYSTRSQGIPMQIVLDGMFMESDALSMITSFDVETIEVLRGIGNTAIYGSRGGGGVIIITTKRGDSGSYNRNLYTPGIVTHSPQGYYAVREFYSPDYSVSDTLSGMKDLRTTVYWAPNIVTDEKGEAHIEFYTAGEAGTYRIVVEGLDPSGRIGRTVYFINVE